MGLRSHSLGEDVEDCPAPLGSLRSALGGGRAELDRRGVRARSDMRGPPDEATASSIDSTLFRLESLLIENAIMAACRR